MTKRTIAYDITRLFIGPLNVTPRGIDRVEIGYARQIFGNYTGDCVGVLPTPWGIRLFERRQVNTGLNALEAIWRETIDPTSDAVLAGVRAWLGGTDQHGEPAAAMPRQSRPSAFGRQCRLVWETGIHLGRSAPRSLAKSSVYINCGQIGLTMPFTLNWLRSRTDIRTVFMLHDLIPLQHTQFVPPAATRAHKRAIRNTIAHADAVIVPSLAMQPVIAAELEAGGRADIPITAVPLPVSPVFMERAPCRRPSHAPPYLVMPGNLDPRKNHALILDVWKDLVGRYADETPKLVIVGGRGISGEMAHVLTGDRRNLGTYVYPVSGLSTPGLRELMREATAVLMPSLAEGYGLPIVEALSLGTPVIASDIPAHREAGAGFAILLDPHERGQWVETIGRFIGDPAGSTQIRRNIQRFRPLGWDTYFEEISKSALLL